MDRSSPAAENLPFAPFDEHRIRAVLSAAASSVLAGIAIFPELASTNQHLSRLGRGRQHGQVILADKQTAGRGRAGRSWHSPGGCNIHLSLGWRLASTVDSLSGLPLAIGIAVARAVACFGVADVRIKWPNDLIIGRCKFGGILVETSQAGGAGTVAVIGIGINVSMAAQPGAQSSIDQPWTDICSHLQAAREPDLRDRLTGCLLNELLATVRLFEVQGLAPFMSDWRRLDAISGRQIKISCGAAVIFGRALGVDTRGCLVVECVGSGGAIERRSFHAGEVSIRC